MVLCGLSDSRNKTAFQHMRNSIKQVSLCSYHGTAVPVLVLESFRDASRENGTELSPVPFFPFCRVITSWTLGRGGGVNGKDFHSPRGRGGQAWPSYRHCNSRRNVLWDSPLHTQHLQGTGQDPTRVSKALGTAWEAVGCWIGA